MARKYKITTEPIFEGCNLDAQGCNVISFTNKGTATANIGSFPLAPNESHSFEGGPGEIDTTVYLITFGAGTAALYATRKTDLNENG